MRNLSADGKMPYEKQAVATEDQYINVYAPTCVHIKTINVVTYAHVCTLHATVPRVLHH